jgi:CheY-like chemotaxis protein
VIGSEDGGAVQPTVLIVDDSKLARMVVDEALARAQDQRVHVALIDFNMPGSDGLMLAAELRQHWPALPIAIISANVQDEIIARARSLDATFIPKPVNDEALGAFLSGATLRLRRGAV